MCSSVWSQEDERPKAKVPPVSAERETAALEFVKEHQPELARLLEYLRHKQPRQYQRAVRELARTADRLKMTRERDPQRYELELQAWQVRSRIDLLAARWKVQPDEKIKERLRAAIVEQMTLQKQILERERDKVAQRLKTVESQLEKLNNMEPAEIERRLKAATEGRSKPVLPQRDGTHGPEQPKRDNDQQKQDSVR
jgi:exonuclease VII large subunit